MAPVVFSTGRGRLIGLWSPFWWKIIDPSPARQDRHRLRCVRSHLRGQQRRINQCLAASQARGLAGAQGRQGLVPILRRDVRIETCLSNQVQALSGFRSDLCGARSTNNSGYQPWPAGRSPISRWCGLTRSAEFICSRAGADRTPRSSARSAQTGPGGFLRQRRRRTEI